MPKKTPPRLEFDPSIVSQLACPVCHGDLRFEVPSLDALKHEALNLEAPSPGGSSRLVCAACGRAYPIVDGIPDLIVDWAEMPGNSSNGT